MTNEHDDFDDAATATLLRKWGGDVREAKSGALFEPPANVQSATKRNRFRFSRVHVLLSVAAVLALAAGGWWIAQRFGAGPTTQKRELTLGEIALTSTPTLLRGEEPMVFRSGDTLYVHLHSDRAGSAFVALLDTRLEFVPVTAGTVLPLVKGANRLGPFPLDDATGTESVVILATEETLEPRQFEALVKRTGAMVQGTSKEHSERLREIITIIGAHRDLAVRAATFAHEPR